MLREFKDQKGVDWLVWDVYPTSGSAADPRTSDPGSNAFPHRELNDGWLCFESATEKRRVTPIPPGWQLWRPEKLEALCSGAGYISRASTRVTPGGSEVVPGETESSV